MISRPSASSVLIVMVVGLILGSCSTMRSGRLQQAPLSSLELVASLEQTRELNIEDNLTYALSRLFGVDNVVVLVSSRAHYGIMEERVVREGGGTEPRREFHRRTAPGDNDRTTVVVIINASAVTPEQTDDIEKLRDDLRQIIVDGTGMRLGDGSADSVTISFIPFSD